MSVQGASVPASEEQLRVCEKLVTRWLDRQLLENPTVLAAEREPDTDQRLWMLRLLGEEKANFTVWFELRQRTLRVETYLCPAPLENHAELYGYLLRRNADLMGLAFSIGPEAAVYLAGRAPIEWLDEDRLDALLGAAYAATEQTFRRAMQIGYGARFKG